MTVLKTLTMPSSPIPDHELPGWLVLIILGLVICCLLLALAFLGYLPSPLSAQLTAHDFAGRRSDRAALITCGTTAELAKRDPLRCFDNDDPKTIFLGAR